MFPCHRGQLSPTLALVFQHTTASLAECAGCTPATILEWRKLGLFDGIETSRTSGGKSKGVQLLWHTDAMARVKEIVELKAQGYNTELLKARFRKPEPARAKTGQRPKKRGTARSTTAAQPKKRASATAAKPKKRGGSRTGTGKSSKPGPR